MPSPRVNLPSALPGSPAAQGRAQRAKGIAQKENAGENHEKEPHSSYALRHALCA